MRTRVFLTAFFAAALLLAPVAEANADAPCSLDQVKRAPESVIDPCSVTISDRSARPKDRGYALFIRGMGYHNTKRFDLARQDYDAAIKLTPSNEELLASRANISFRAGDPEEAVSFLQRVIELNPKNGHALRSMGALFAQSGQSEQAEQFYTMALADDPNDAYALLFRSQNYAKRRDFARALKDADALAAILPANINLQGYLDVDGDKQDFHIVALKNRSKVHDGMGRSDLAEADLKAAVEYSRSSQSFSALGEFLAYKPGRGDDASLALDEAIRFGSTSSLTYYAKGHVLITQKREKEALAAFDKAGSLDPYFGDAFLMRARLHRAFDETDAAVDDIAHAISVDPDVRAQTMGTMSRIGYWRSGNPDALTPELMDALRACMLDKGCN